MDVGVPTAMEPVMPDARSVTLMTFGSWMPATEAALFEFHRDAANLPLISPPVPRMRLVSAPGPCEQGDTQVIELGVGALKRQWTARVTQVIDPRLIEDVQESGPFLSWRHQHRFTHERDGARLTDVVSFRLLPTKAGEVAEYFLVAPVLWLTFGCRHRKTRRLFEARRLIPAGPAGGS